MKVTDTRPLFRPLCAEIVSLLRSLSADDWARPTIAGTWRVRDVTAHLLDLVARRLSFHRDRLVPPPPPAPIAGERAFVAFINELNASWIGATTRLSPRVLTDLFELTSRDLAEFFETLPDDAPALFPVSWAGDTSVGWLDIGREFTEIWHHGAQIRHAVAAGSFEEPRWLRAVLEISLRALPHAYRDVEAADGARLCIEIAGASGGTWTLRRESGRWHLDESATPAPTATVRMSDETAWRLLFNALRPEAAAAQVQVEGSRELVVPLLQTRSVIV